MTIKLNQLSTNYSIDKKEATKLSYKVSQLLDDATPRNIIGMLATAKETNRSIIFYNRWELMPVEKNNFGIFDRFSKEYVFEHISLSVSALQIIWNLHKSSKFLSSSESVIYRLDQEYYRCVENIKFYKKKISITNSENVPVFLAKLEDSRFRLKEIKSLLSKIY